MMYINEKHKKEVKERGYKYIGTYNKDDIMLDKRKIMKGKNIYIFIECSYCHNRYSTQIGGFKGGQNCPKCCGCYENSFAYHIEIELGEKLDKYWDWNKNKFNPYHITKKNDKKVWIKCKDIEYHIYDVTCRHFTEGNRCPFCNPFASHRVHLYDSFGYNHFDKVCINWSNRNNVSPFKISCRSPKKFLFYCDKCKKEFKKILNNMVKRDEWCPYCSMSKGEKKIEEWLKKYNIEHIYEKTYDDLLGLKGGVLSYDFYLPQFNLLIEYQGEHHEKVIDGFGGLEKFEAQQEHDKRKRKYAENNGYKLLEIWYWDYDNIEEILDKNMRD